jgi:hypothetical protein
VQTAQCFYTVMHMMFLCDLSGLLFKYVIKAAVPLLLLLQSGAQASCLLPKAWLTSLLAANPLPQMPAPHATSTA